MASRYRCRLCQAKMYRRLRGSELYRCSGCAVVFADPIAWREGKPEEPLPEPVRNWLATYGGQLPMDPPEMTQEELQRIREAAARANRSKGRKR